MNVLLLNNLPIFEQLKLEEALLRTNSDNWLLINTGSPKAIVMGISSKPEEVIDLKRAAGIPIIQRFSGGGTVIVDEETLFVTFIRQESSYPKAVLDWVFSAVSGALPHLSLRENDFTLGEKKVAGNAQYLRKERWLHHTSFLWNFDPKNMSCLLHPPKEPPYRQGRSHLDFLAPLAPHMTKQDFISRLLSHLEQAHPLTINPPLPLFPSHRKALSLW